MQRTAPMGAGYLGLGARPAGGAYCTWQGQLMQPLRQQAHGRVPKLPHGNGRGTPGPQLIILIKFPALYTESPNIPVVPVYSPCGLVAKHGKRRNVDTPASCVDLCGMPPGTGLIGGYILDARQPQPRPPSLVVCFTDTPNARSTVEYRKAAWGKEEEEEQHSGQVTISRPGKTRKANLGRT